jgi:GT2 family glycosyltransferase
VVNFNGGAITLRSLAALRGTDWPAESLDIVLVDNASQDGVATTVEHDMPSVRVMRSATNRGFAGGNNLGIGDLDGIDAVALVNNDVTVPSDWLQPLAAALHDDADLGAVAPKMLLDGTFRRVDLSMDAEPPWRADPRVRGVRLVDVIGPAHATGRVRYATGFFEPERRDGRTFRWTMPEATIFVPVPLDAAGSVSCTLVVESDRCKHIEVRSGGETLVLDVRRGVHQYEVGLRGESFDLVNNTGSVLLPNGYAADRGWLEPDRGQYDNEEDVVAWCGGAVLLRADYLRDVGRFDERLFLYYEDLELSWRGQRRGWRYRYVPRSVVRHAHSATAAQDSPLARYYNERNRLLVLARHATISRLVAAVTGYVSTTASFARRELVAPLLRGERPHADILPSRLRSFAGFAIGAPGQLRDRRLTSRSARR